MRTSLVENDLQGMRKLKHLLLLRLLAILPRRASTRQTGRGSRRSGRPWTLLAVLKGRSLRNSADEPELKHPLILLRLPAIVCSQECTRVGMMAWQSLPLEERT